MSPRQPQHPLRRPTSRPTRSYQHPDPSSSLGLTLRSATLADADAVVGLWDQALARSENGSRAIPYSSEEFSQFATAAQVTIAEREGEALGAVGLIEPTSPRATVAEEGELELSRLAVAAPIGRIGVATSLLAHCREHATRQLAGAIVLSTRPSQIAAHYLYQRLGYARQPHRDAVDGGGDPQLVYRLILPLRPVPRHVPPSGPGFWP